MLDEEKIILSGTKSEICNELISEFNTNKDEAEFIFHMSIFVNQDKCSTDKDWELESLDREKSPIYDTQFLNTNYNIDYSKVKRDLFVALIKFAKSVFQEESQELGLSGCIKPIMDLVLDLGLSFINNMSKVHDSSLCVYYNIMKRYKENKQRFFTEEDFNIYNRHNDGDCIYRDQIWICPHISKTNQECSMTKHKLNETLKNLSENNILQYDKENSRWRLI